MNDVNTLLIASTVLAIGGLGFYMYKNEQVDDICFDNLEEDLDYSTEEDDDEEEYDEEEEEEPQEEEEMEQETIGKKNRTRRNNPVNTKTKKKRY